MFSWIRHYVAEECALPSALLVFLIIFRNAQGSDLWLYTQPNSQVHYVSKSISIQNLGRLDNLYIFRNVITWRIRKSMFTFTDIPPWWPFLDFQNGGHAGMSANVNMYF